MAFAAGKNLSTLFYGLTCFDKPLVGWLCLFRFCTARQGLLFVTWNNLYFAVIIFNLLKK